MHIVVGSDHRGFHVKIRLVQLLEQLGHEVFDVGTDSSDRCDYPDFAVMAARKVAAGEADRGVLVCGTGIGMALAANKVSGVRAGVCDDVPTAETSRRHNDLNVLCLSAGMIGGQDDETNLEPLIKIWLETEFDGGRHARRVDKITKIENERPLS